MFSYNLHQMLWPSVDASKICRYVNVLYQNVNVCTKWKFSWFSKICIEKGLNIKNRGVLYPCFCFWYYRMRRSCLLAMAWIMSDPNTLTLVCLPLTAQDQLLLPLQRLSHHWNPSGNPSSTHSLIPFGPRLRFCL